MSSDLWDVTGTLAEYADCGTPDAVDSPGAEWLRYVAMVFVGGLTLVWLFVSGFRCDFGGSMVWCWWSTVVSLAYGW